MEFNNVIISVLACALAFQQVHAGQDAASGQSSSWGKYALIGGAALAAGAAAYAFFARSESGKRIFDRARHYFSPPSQETLEQFFRAVEDGDLPTVQRFIESGAVHIEARNGSKTALIVAARLDHESVVRWLIEKGANVNAHSLDLEGNTALHVTKSVAVARLLLDAGADVDAKDRIFRRTPLHGACLSANTDIIRLLLEAGADTSARDEARETPLHRAASVSTPECAVVVRQLLEHGVNNFNDLSWCRGSATPLLCSIHNIKNGQPTGYGAAKALVEYGAPLTLEVEQLLSQFDGRSSLRDELIKARNIPILRQALRYLDQDEHRHGTRVPPEIQNIIRDMVLEPEQVARFAQLR